MLCRFLSVALASIVASNMWASEKWPQWRGPARDAVSAEKGLLDRWENAPPLVWKTGGLGPGYAGAVVDHGMVFTMGDRDGKAAVVALDDQDGKVLWTSEIDDAFPSGHSASKSTPTVDNERVYALSAHGKLACLKINTGELIWEKSCKHDFNGRVVNVGYAESPLIDGDKLICTPGGSTAGMVALNKKTGAEVWRCPVSFAESTEKGAKDAVASFSSIAISHAGGIKQYVQAMTRGLVGVDAATGKQLWSYERVAAGSHPCTPIVHGDYVFLPGGFDIGSALLKLTPARRGGLHATEVYFLGKETATGTGGAVLVGDYVYCSHAHTGSPQCMELLTGKMMWRKQRGPGTGAAAIAYADGRVYFRYDNGVTALAAATPDEFQLKGKFRTPIAANPCFAHPAICNGRLYLRSDDVVYCYNLKK